MDQVEQKLFETGALTTDNNAVIFYTWECIKGGFQLVPCLYNRKFLTNVTFHSTINSPKVPLREGLVHTCELEPDPRRKNYFLTLSPPDS